MVLFWYLLDCLFVHLFGYFLGIYLGIYLRYQDSRKIVLVRRTDVGFATKG